MPKITKGCKSTLEYSFMFPGDEIEATFDIAYEVEDYDPGGWEYPPEGGGIELGVITCTEVTVYSDDEPEPATRTLGGNPPLADEHAVEFVA